MTRPTDKELESAYRAIGPEAEEVVEEVVEEEEEILAEGTTETEEVEEPEVAPEEELSPAEKSGLGRKLADERREREKLEANLREASEKIAKMEGLIEGIGRQGHESAPPEEPDQEETLTRGEAREEYKRLLAEDKAKEKAITDKHLEYSDEYTRLANERLEGSDSKEEIFKLFRSADGKYDIPYTGDPAEDLDINLAKAEREVLRVQNLELNKKLAGKNKKMREDDTDGAGVGGDSPDVTEEHKPKGTPGKMAGEFLAHLDKADPKYAKKLRTKHY